MSERAREGARGGEAFGCVRVLRKGGHGAASATQRMQWPWHWGGWIEKASLYFDLSLVSNGSINVIQVAG